MVPEDAHDFFVASASAAAALIGLLFVALSVWQGRELRGPEAESHRLRAAGALTVFTNALVVSLYGLIPRTNVGETATIVAALGLAYVVASTMRGIRVAREQGGLRVRDLAFLVGGLALFIFELLAGIAVWFHPHRAGGVDDVADLVGACLLFGIARSWELIGGPQVGVVREVSALFRGPAKGDSESEPESEPEREPESDAPTSAERG